MKQAITFIFLLLNFFAFSQDKKTITSGYITFNSGSTLFLKNIVIENENVSCFNEVSQKQINFSLQSVKKIVDSYGVVVYDISKSLESNNESVKYSYREKTVEERLVYKSSSKILMNGKKLDTDELEKLFLKNRTIYYRYKKGKSGATVGTIMMGGGLGLFIGGGLSNLANSNNGKGGSPAILIAGIVIGTVGIPVRIVGVSNLKKSVIDYNELSVREVSFFEKSELKVIAGVGGVGLQWQF